MNVDWTWTYGLSRFRDRRDAGRRLAERLRDYRGRPDVLVLALPRGGVPVGFEIARALEAPLDVLIVRKLGLPGHEELAMGAIASGGVRVLNPEVVRPLRIPEQLIESVAARERLELERREQLYRGGRSGYDPAGRRVMLVDDGLATGATMKAGIAALRQRRPAEIVVAVPVAPASTCGEMASLADRVVCLLQPELFGGVGEWYQDFRQTSDAEVSSLLAAAARSGAPPAGVAGDS
jgi:putative phosphoribosyl transferase